MKRVKILATIGIIVCAIGVFGSVVMLGEGDASGGVLGLTVYGFFLWLSIEVRCIK